MLPVSLRPSFQDISIQPDMQICPEDQDELDNQFGQENHDKKSTEIPLQTEEGSSEGLLAEAEPKNKTRKQKKWGPVVAETKSSRVAQDNRPIQKKATDFKRAKNLEDNYPSKRELVRYQNGAEEKLEACEGLAANVQAKSAGEHTPMVQLLGGGAEDPFGDRRFIKKIKTGGVNLGLMMQILEDRKKVGNNAWLKFPDDVLLFISVLNC